MPGAICAPFITSDVVLLQVRWWSNSKIPSYHLLSQVSPCSSCASLGFPGSRLRQALVFSIIMEKGSWDQYLWIGGEGNKTGKTQVLIWDANWISSTNPTGSSLAEMAHCSCPAQGQYSQASLFFAWSVLGFGPLGKGASPWARWLFAGEAKPEGNACQPQSSWLGKRSFLDGHLVNASQRPPQLSCQQPTLEIFR